MSPWSWNAAARTHVGQVRSQNEDALLMRPDRGLFVVADGMGGHAAGEVASALAVETLDRELGGGVDEDVLEETVRAANRVILRAARQDPARSGMGTTLTALVLRRAGTWLAAQVGDSRAYRLGREGLERLTRDHSWIQAQVAAGRLDAESARGHPMSGVLTRALGTESDVEVDTYAGELRDGDLFLLASDGLTDLVPDGRIEALLRQGIGEPRADDAEPPQRAADALVEAALDAGGRDNVTVVLARTRRSPDGER